MISRILNSSENNSKLLLIFTGWSSNGDLYRNLGFEIPSDWDIIVLSNFDADSVPFIIPGRYSTVYLLAWSFGVAAAERLISPERITMAFAVNGSPFPVSDTLGIPKHIFNGTFANLDLRNLKKFHRRMVESSDDYKALELLLPDKPNIDFLKNELLYFGSFRHYSPSLPWKRVFIAQSDRIIPPENQRNAWQSIENSPEIININGGHFPDFIKLLKSLIPDNNSVATHFSASLNSYNESATAQNKITSHLTEKLKDLIEQGRVRTSEVKILEIGSGSGLFTKKWSGLFKNPDVTYIDLYPLPEYKVALRERYIVADAEEWIKKTNEKFDLILSASTMQWFADPVGFISEAFDRLKPGGTLILSTFLPGNLGELDSLRPSPVIYHPESSFLKIIKVLTDDYLIEKDKIELKFENSRQALLHLKKTGVGYSAVKLKRSEVEAAIRMPDGTARLTFTPLYIFITRN